MTARLLHGVLLTGVWLLALGSLSVVDAAVGALLTVLLLWAVGDRPGVPRAPGPALLRAALLVRLAAVALARALVGSVQVARVLVQGTWRGRAGVVEVPLAEQTEVGASVTGLVATLSPGTVLLGVDRERRVLRLHVLDATDPEAVQRALRAFYLRYQRRLFP